MRFAILIAFLLSAGIAGAQLQEREAAEPTADANAGLVDEDEDLLPKTDYAFNPIQAIQDIKVGDFYAKRGNHRAAAGRYLEATKWNPQSADAYFRLAEARDELRQEPQALDAYRSYLALDPTGKQSKKAKQRIEQLEEALKSLPLAAGEEEATPDEKGSPQ